MPPDVVIETLALADGEKKVKDHPSARPCSSNGLVLSRVATTASGFQALALTSALANMSASVIFGSLSCSILHASCASAGAAANAIAMAQSNETLLRRFIRPPGSCG